MALWRLLILNLAFLSGVCGAVESLEMLRVESRQILRTRLCGNCHIPPGNSRALKIYNLDRENWAFSMSERQLEQIPGRADLQDEEIVEMGGDPHRHKFTKRELEILNRYVRAEIKDRNPAATLFGAEHNQSGEASQQR